MDEANGAVEEREKKEEEVNNAGIPIMEINSDARCPEGYIWIKPSKTFTGDT